jgi:hypothetical protein
MVTAIKPDTIAPAINPKTITFFFIVSSLNFWYKFGALGLQRGHTLG